MLDSIRTGIFVCPRETVDILLPAPKRGVWEKKRKTSLGGHFFW